MATDETEYRENAQALRDHLLSLLNGGQRSYQLLKTLWTGFPLAKCSQRIKALALQLRGRVLRGHMRIGAVGIFSNFAVMGKNHVSPKWPEGYWPAPKRYRRPDPFGGKTLCEVPRPT